MLYPAERRRAAGHDTVLLSQFHATTHRNMVRNYLVTSPLSVAPSREKTIK